MKHSIKIIFKNITTLWLFIIFMLVIGGFNILSEHISFNQIENLNNQKNIIATLQQLNGDDTAFAQIQFNGKSTELLNEIDKLRTLSKYDFIGEYIIGHKIKYHSDLDSVIELIHALHDKALNYYTKKNENIKLTSQELHVAFTNINNKIDTLKFAIFSYEEIKFHIFEKIYAIIFILTLLTTLWFSIRLKTIYQDIFSLFAISTEKIEHEIFSQEIDAIALKMKKRATPSNTKSLLDQETGLYNLQGLTTACVEKKHLQHGEILSITILEIDNFTKFHQMFTTEVRQNMIKNISFAISLHQQSTDIIGRIQDNQFVVILYRDSKEKALKEVDAIRQNISALEFLNNDGKTTHITLSGGFVIANESIPFEKTIDLANQVLHQAIIDGGNKITQVSNLARL